MRRLLRGRTWRIRGSNAAETSMVVAVAALVVPVLIFVVAGVITYRDIERQAEERISRTLELLYNSVRATFESEYLVATNVAELLDDYGTNAEIRADEKNLHERLKRLVDRLPKVRGTYRANANLGQYTWFRVGGPAVVSRAPVRFRAPVGLCRV